MSRGRLVFMSDELDTQKRYLGLAIMLGLPMQTVKKYATSDTYSDTDWFEIPEQVVVDRMADLIAMRNGLK